MNETYDSTLIPEARLELFVEDDAIIESKHSLKYSTRILHLTMETAVFELQNKLREIEAEQQNPSTIENTLQPRIHQITSEWSEIVNNLHRDISRLKEEAEYANEEFKEASRKHIYKIIEANQ